MTGRPLSEEQLLAFLRDGFLQLTPESLTDEHHRFFYQRAADLYEIGDAVESPTVHLDVLGDNLRPQVPEVDLLLNDPVIDGAVASILGSDYLVHPHSFCHRSGPRDQVFHQDGNLPWNERAHQRSHRPEWAILFYYPEAVDETNGPTEIIPGSQYFTVDNELPDGEFRPDDRVVPNIDNKVFGGPDLALRDRQQAEALEQGLPIPGLTRRFLQVPAGSAVLAHYDLFHRGSRVAGAERPRYMYKFNLVRAHEPSRDQPSYRVGFASAAERLAERPSTAPIAAANLRWLTGFDPLGGSGQPTDAQADFDAKADLDALTTGRQDEQLAAAYRLGRLAETDSSALAALEAALTSSAESSRRAASHGLKLAGPAGVPILLRGLASSEATIRRPSIAGLGTGEAAKDHEAVAAMVAAMTGDPDDLVRSNAAYSLGHLVRAPLDAGTVAMIVDGLLDRLAPGAEPDNATAGGFARSTVRQSAGYALALALCNHPLDDERLDAIIDGPLRDLDRYVQGLVADGLGRTEHLSVPARRRMVEYLVSRRWNRSPSVDPIGAPAAV